MILLKGPKLEADFRYTNFVVLAFDPPPLPPSPPVHVKFATTPWSVAYKKHGSGVLEVWCAHWGTARHVNTEEGGRCMSKQTDPASEGSHFADPRHRTALGHL